MRLPQAASNPPQNPGLRAASRRHNILLRLMRAQGLGTETSEQRISTVRLQWEV